MEKLPALSIDLELTEALKRQYLNTKLEPDLNTDRTSHLLHRLGTPPLFTTLRINTQLIEPDVALMKVEEAITKQYADRGKSAPNIYLHPVILDVIVVENSGPNFDILQSKCDVIVDHSCGMAVLRGADVFAQGIIGAPQYMKKGDKVSIYTDLEGKCLKGLITPYNGTKVFVGNGVAQYSRDDLYRSEISVRGIGIQMTEPLYDAPSLSDLLQEYIFPQNLPSIICSCVLRPQAGETILDMCAAPGGKTCHIATLMKNTGRLVAIDKTDNKVQRINSNMKAWRLDSIEAYKYDSTKLLDSTADISGAPPYPPESFDRILLDGPCSALGLRPSLVNKIRLKDLKSYPIVQKKLLRQAVPLLKTGGTLVYSTCTINVEENENMVDWLLKEFDVMELVVQDPHLASPSTVCSKLSSEQSAKLQRFNPCHTEEKPSYDNDTIGFFIAKFIKRKSIPFDR